jgi:chitinase
VAVDPAARQRLCTAAASYIREYGFDGIDLDWEYPSGGGHPHNTRRPEDPENYRILMLELRDALDRAAANAPGRRYLISAAAAAAPERVAPVDYRRFSDVYDRINLMSYDYFGEWDARCGHQANLQAADKSGAAEKLSGERAVAAYREAGFEALQIHFGLPLYARSWITDDPHALPGSAGVAGSTSPGSALPHPPGNCRRPRRIRPGGYGSGSRLDSNFRGGPGAYSSSAMHR